MSLLDEIRACPPALLAARDTQAIADHLSIGRTALVPGTLMGEGLVWAQLGFAAGSQVLDRFEALAEANPMFVRPARALREARLDIGLQVTRDAIAALVPAGVMTAKQLEQLLAPGLRPDPIPEFDVRRACWADDGTWIP